jgi:hypothetical protein
MAGGMRSALARVRRPFVVSETASARTSRGSRSREGGEGGWFEAEPAPQLGHRQWALLPEGEHDEVLRVRESHRLQQRTVEADDVPRGHSEGEADLPVESEQIVGRRGGGHGRDGGHVVMVVTDAV